MYPSGNRYQKNCNKIATLLFHFWAVDRKFSFKRIWFVWRKKNVMASFGTCYHEYEKVIKDFATKWKIDKNKMHCISQPNCSELLGWFIVATDFFTTGPGFSNLFFRRAKFVGLNLLNRPLFSIKTPSKFQIFFCISKVRTKKISSAPRKTLRNSEIQKKNAKILKLMKGR